MELCCLLYCLLPLWGDKGRICQIMNKLFPIVLALLFFGCSVSSETYKPPEIGCSEEGYCDSAPGLKKPYDLEEYGKDILVKNETVIITCFIDIDGNPKYCEVSKSSGIEKLDSLALKSVKKSEWYPATQCGEKVGVYISIPFNFTGL